MQINLYQVSFSFLFFFFFIAHSSGNEAHTSEKGAFTSRKSRRGDLSVVRAPNSQVKTDTHYDSSKEPIFYTKLVETQVASAICVGTHLLHSQLDY